MSNLTFTPSFGNLAIRNKDVVMIECSFDLGKIKLFLFPWSEKNNLSKLVSPAPPPLVQPVKTSKPAIVGEPKSPAASRPTFWEWISGKKPSQPSDKNMPAPWSEQPVDVVLLTTKPPAPSVPAAGQITGSDSRPRQNFSSKQPVPKPENPSVSKPSGFPDRPNRVDDAMKKFVYVPASTAGGILGAPDSNPPAPRNEAQVLSYDRNHQFITLDAGSHDGFSNDMVVSVVRDGLIIAKARVRQLREHLSAAVVIPESIRTDIQTGDKIRFA